MGHNLWSHVECCTTIGAGGVLENLGKAEIPDFADKTSSFFSVQKNIITFYVTMDNIFWVDRL